MQKGESHKSYKGASINAYLLLQGLSPVKTESNVPNVKSTKVLLSYYILWTRQFLFKSLHRAVVIEFNAMPINFRLNQIPIIASCAVGMKNRVCQLDDTGPH